MGALSYFVDWEWVCRRYWAKEYSLESAVSVCSSQAARTRGIAIVRRL
jgi:hypothetical protein